MIDFDRIEPEDVTTTLAIAARAVAQDPRLDVTSTSMDICAVHLNSPLRLADMLDADTFDLMHDVYGIARYLDRETGEIGGGFLPRFTA